MICLLIIELKASIQNENNTIYDDMKGNSNNFKQII